MELVPHAAAKRLIDALMLLHTRLAAEALRHHPRLIMVAVAGQIDDLDPRVGNPLADQALDLGGGHRHNLTPGLR